MASFHLELQQELACMATPTTSIPLYPAVEEKVRSSLFLVPTQSIKSIVCILIGHYYFGVVVVLACVVGSY